LDYDRSNCSLSNIKAATKEKLIDYICDGLKMKHDEQCFKFVSDLWDDGYGDYLVSDITNIMHNLKPNKFAYMTFEKGFDYPSVALYVRKSEKRRTMMVSRLVCNAHEGPILPRMQIDHKNEETDDNNLRMVTPYNTIQLHKYKKLGKNVDDIQEEQLLVDDAVDWLSLEETTIS
jgi:hypothetical protein